MPRPTAVYTAFSACLVRSSTEMPAMAQTLLVWARVRGRRGVRRYPPRVVEPEAKPPAPPCPVVAVVVTHDPPAERLDRLVSALAAQTYPNLEVWWSTPGPRTRATGSAPCR